MEAHDNLFSEVLLFFKLVFLGNGWQRVAHRNRRTIHYKDLVMKGMVTFTPHDTLNLINLPQINMSNRAEAMRLRLGREDDSNAMKECRLDQGERFWRDHYFWLRDKGYVLRPRYHPDWVASWKDTDKSWLFCEDGQVMPGASKFLDGTRISDGATVMFKKDSIAKHPNESAIGHLLSGEPHSSNVTNHCVHVYDVLNIPDDDNHFIIVMPLLQDWAACPFDTIGESVEMFRQLFEGLRFMHSLGVAHNDIKFDNVMMDGSPLYDEPLHPVDAHMKRDYSGRAAKPQSRTLRPVKYYYIDFGHACQYNISEGPASEPVGYGGDSSVPEFKTQERCDPFPVDVYRVGNLIRKSFTHGYERKHGFDFMKPLLQDMCQDDPTKRPTMEEVVLRFAQIMNRLSSWKLRSPVVKRYLLIVSLFRAPSHWLRQFRLSKRQIPAVPRA